MKVLKLYKDGRVDTPVRGREPVSQGVGLLVGDVACEPMQTGPRKSKNCNSVGKTQKLTLVFRTIASDPAWLGGSAAN